MFGVDALSGNLAVAMSMASPRMGWRSAARERMDSVPPRRGSAVSLGL